MVFEGALDSIGHYAFGNCSRLESVSFGGPVQSIGDSAFYGCTRLDGVSLPEGSSTIGSYAFYGCSSLKTLDLPESVGYIESYGFYDSGVTEITLKDYDIRFGDHPFSWPTCVYCALESDTAHRLSDAHTIFMPNQLDQDHQSLQDTAVRYIRNANDGTETLRFCYYVGSDSFITLYDKIESLEPVSSEHEYGMFQQENAYGHTGGARILAAPGSETARMISEGGYGFAPDTASDFDYIYQNDKLYVYFSFCARKLAEGTYTGETRVKNGVTIAAFTALPGGAEGILAYAFGIGNSEYTDPFYHLHDSNYEPGEEEAFYNSSWIEPADTLLICAPGSDLARAAGEAKYVCVHPDNLDLRMLSSADGTTCRMLKYLTGDEDLTVPEGITAMESNCFVENYNLYYVPNNTELKSVRLPSTLEKHDYNSVGNAPFYRCMNLQNVFVSEGVTELGNYQLLAGQFNDIYDMCQISQSIHYWLPASLTAINNNAIRNLYKYEYDDEYGMEYEVLATFIHAPIDSYAARWASAKFGKFTAIPDDSWDYKWQEEKLYLAGYHGESAVITELPESIEGVLPDADLGNARFVAEDVDSDFAHRVSAFYTSADSEFRLGWDGDRLTLRKYVGSATRVEITAGIQKIGKYAVSSQSNLIAVTLPEGLKEIDDYGFDSCSNLTQINFPEGLERIGDYAFRWSNNYLSDPQPLPFNKEYAITLPDSLTSLGRDAFSNTVSNLFLPDNMTELEPRGEWNLLYVTIGSPTSRLIGENTEMYSREDGNCYVCLDGKWYMTNFSQSSGLPVSMDELAVGLCQYNARLVFGYASDGNLKLPDHCTELIRVGNNNELAFIQYCSMTTLSLPEGIVSIPAYFARNNANLTNLVLPESIQSIDPNAFDNSLTTVFGHGGSYAETWAADKNLLFIDMDDPDSLAENVVIEKAVSKLYVGDVVDVRTLVRVMPEIGDPLPLAAESKNESLLSVDGTTLTVKKPGTVTLYMWVEGH